MSLRSSGLIAEDLDGALTHGDDGTLDVLALTDPVAGAVGLALAVLGSDGTDLDAEDALQGNLDLGLVRAGVNLEGVLARSMRASDFSVVTGFRMMSRGFLPASIVLTWSPPWCRGRTQGRPA